MIFQACNHLEIRYQPDKDAPNYSYTLVMANIDKTHISDIYIRKTIQLKPMNPNSIKLLKQDENIEVYKMYFDKFIFIFEDIDIAIKYFKYIVSLTSGENREITEVYPELFL